MVHMIGNGQGEANQEKGTKSGFLARPTISKRLSSNNRSGSPQKLLRNRLTVASFTPKARPILAADQRSFKPQRMKRHSSAVIHPWYSSGLRRGGPDRKLSSRLGRGIKTSYANRRSQDAPGTDPLAQDLGGEYR